MSRSASVLETRGDRSGAAAAWDLVRSAQRGDREAFGQLYRRYRPRVLGYLMVRTGDRALAEDLTSETFLLVFENLPALRWKERPVHAWLTTIARNLATDTYRSARHRREVLTDTFREHQLTEPGPEERTVDDVEFEHVREQLFGLSPDQRRCLDLRFMQQLSTAEAVRRMNREAGALRRLAALCTADSGQPGRVTRVAGLRQPGIRGRGPQECPPVSRVESDTRSSTAKRRKGSRIHANAP